MPEKIIEVSEEILKKKVKEGKIKFSGDPVEPPPVGSIPVEIITPVNTTVITSGGTSTTGVSRRTFLWGAGAAIIGVGFFIGIEDSNRKEAARQEAARAVEAEVVYKAEATRAEASRRATSVVEVARQETARAEAVRKEADRLYPGVIEKAVALFGEDFLGEQAIHKLEDKFRTSGFDVKFEIPIVPFHLSQAQLENAKRDTLMGKARMVVLRPEFMTVKGKRQPITFQSLYVSSGDGGNNNNFPSGFDYPYGEWSKEGLKARFALPTKEVVPGSLGKTWNEQEKLIQPGESRRELVEALWDILLYYSATSKRLLGDTLDWTKTNTYEDYFGCLGKFTSKSYGTYSLRALARERELGVCTTL